MTVHNPYDDTALLALIADLDDDIVAMQADIDALVADVALIRAVTDGLPTLTEVAGTTTTTDIDTEYDLYINNAPLGVYRPISVNVWMLNQTAAETVVIRTYYRPATGAVMALVDTQTFTGVIAPVLLVIDLHPNRWGVQVTIERTAGSARAYPWEAFYEI